VTGVDHRLELLLGVVAATAYAVMLGREVLSNRVRRGIAALAVAAAACLASFACFADGTREARPRTLIAHHHYAASHEVAPAYAAPLVYAAGCALLAFTMSRRPAVRTPWSRPLRIATTIVVLRFAAEKAAAAEPFAHALGLVWMAPGLGIHAWLATRGSPLGATLRQLAIHALAIRIPALLATIAATLFDLGTHFSLMRLERFELPGLGFRVPSGPLDAPAWVVAILLPQLVLHPAFAWLVGATTAVAAKRFTSGGTRGDLP
jgi:hypothetical protein